MTTIGGAAAQGFPQTPALVIGAVHHTRWQPVRHSFTNANYSWLIDLDEPPKLPIWLRHIRFDARDHLTSPPTLSALKAEVLACAQRERLDISGVDRVVMLAQPQMAGYTFNPLTAYWCLAGEQTRAVVLEVHNTYGGRHAYAVTGAAAAAGTTIDKAFYVSPFNNTQGRYAVRLRAGAHRVAISIRLDRDGEGVLIATLSGRVAALRGVTLARTVLRNPLAPQRISALIRLHGIWLWLRRLPVQARPAAETGGAR